MNNMTYLTKRNRILLFIAKILRKLHTPKKINIFFNTRRHSKIISYIENNYSDTIKKYEFSENLNKENVNNQSKIWIFWWQGIENAPPIVKSCIESVISKAKGSEVVIITKNNVDKYSDISEIIYSKLDDKKISLTHFSDILRFNLLKNHGGLWMDATIFVKEEFEADGECDLFTNTGFNDREFFNIASGRWTGFMIGGIKNHELFKFMDEMFERYWKKEDSLIDYFLIDYILNIAYERNIGNFKFFIDNNINNNSNMFRLERHIFDAWDENKFAKICENTNFFKLSYKNKSSRNKNTYNTIYDHLIQNK